MRGILIVFVVAISASFVFTGVKEGDEAYERGDYETALREYRPLAEAGDSEAQAGLGFMYLWGYGVPQDYETAAVWMRRSAEQGNGKAQHTLGLMYRNGDGVPKDPAKAYEWLSLFATHGDPEAFWLLGEVARELGPEQRKELGIADPTLMRAVEIGDAAEVKRLLKRGIDPSLADGIGMTPLILAATFGHTQVARILVDAGADINAVNHEGTSAFSRASVNGHVEIVRLLLKRGADLTNTSAATVDILAAHGDLASLKRLVEAGVDVNTKDHDGYTTLMLACKIGSANQLKVVKLLLQAGADVNARADDGTTALGNAEEFGWTEVADLLRSAGATE